MRSSMMRVCNAAPHFAFAARAAHTVGTQASNGGGEKAISENVKRRVLQVKGDIRNLEMQYKQDQRARVVAAANAKKEAAARKKVLLKERRQRNNELEKKNKVRAAKLVKVQKAKESKLIEKPWLGRGSLPTQPPLLYASEKMKTYKREDGESGLAAVQKLRKEFLALSPEQKAPYEARAAANRAMRADAKKKVQGIRMGPYSLFLKEQYQSVASGISGEDGPKKIPLIAKEVARRWKALTADQKAAYKVKADAIRKEAKENLTELMKKP